MDDLIEIQKSLERTYADDGAQRFTHSHRGKTFSDTSIGSYIVGKAMADLEEAIDTHRKTMDFKSQVAKAVMLCLSPKDLATITIKTMMDLAFSAAPGFKKSKLSGCMSNLSISLGSLLVNHLNFVIIREKNPKAYDHMMDFLKDKSYHYRRRTVSWYKNMLQLPEVSATTPEKAAIGYPLARLAVETTGLFDVLPVVRNNRRINMLFPSEPVFKSVITSIEHLKLMHPLYLPMVVPPIPWDRTTGDGGYLTLPVYPLNSRQSQIKEYMAKGFLQSRFDVLDRLGKIPWEVDSGLVELMEQAYRSNHPSVPLADIDVQLPPKPWRNRKELLWWKQEKPEAVHEWKLQTAKIMEEFYSSRLIGQRMGFLRILSIAKRFQRFTPLYFPWQLDYRGRMYPLPIALNPQGDDFARGLLRFHQRTPITVGGEGWNWYLIHGANLMGQDKVSFDERLQFIRMNHLKIVECAADPFSSQWWVSADKPWCFLAWCREYHRITSGQQNYTQLPVNIDGRCNGLQHLSITIRDSQTAGLVSLLPSDVPSDIYTTVQKAVEAHIPEEHYWKGRVTRQLVKRNTMTTPYNVTRMGMGEQLKAELLALSYNGMLSRDDKIRACQLRDFNYNCIIGLLGKTAELMKWYTEVSRLYMKEGLQISWILPDGYEVYQDIKETKTAKVMLEHKRVVINYRKELPTQNKLRNIHATSPNITHSMDAMHMVMVIRTLDPDVPFAAIHDSFGVPAPQVNPLRRAVINSFVDLYEQFDIISSVKEDYRRKTGKELPPPPDRGDLDIQSVRNSIYAFS